MRLFSGVLDSSSALASAVLGSVSDRLGFSRIVFGRASPSNMPALACSAASSSSAATGAQKPWLFVGLGNPGRMYKGTRHNVGFEMIDAIAEAEGISVSSKQFKAIVGKGLIGDVPVMLAKPQTFMNASGESVSETTPLQLQNQLFSLVLLFTAVYVGRTAGFILQDTTQSISCDLR
ncbi:Peptidyl-tRNA hydrolase chloroplastic [Zea mays]|uniref:Peptidyl-tRNA hydrolase chloroplastic n=1 Tax=Zea mays TaxID=4577 RepID=A0A1D6MBS2_MAIZE|nr:Peptidyl-tRNA hydrolase chloroplastic [Zea mays]